MRLSVLVVVAVVAALGLAASPAAALSSQTISFGPLANKLYGSAPFTVSAITTATGIEQGPIHGSAENDNVCTTTLRPPISLVPDFGSKLPVEIAADAAPVPHLGDPITLSNNEVTATVPAGLLVQGYDFGILTNGEVLAATVTLVIAGSNTTEGTHTYATIHINETLAFHDPDGVPGTGDETADPAAVTVPVPDTVWHPFDPSLPVLFTEKSAVITLVIPIGATNYLSTQTCMAGTPDAFVSVDATSAGTSRPVSFSSLNMSVCTVTGTTVSVSAAGRCTIEATQPGDSNWDAAAPVDRSFVVSYGVASLSPPSGTRFVRGATIPVRFALTDAHGHAIPAGLAASLGCSATVTFNGGSPACAVYDPVAKLFKANVKTSSNLTVGKGYPIGVRVVAGTTTIASATTVAVASAPVHVQNVSRSGYWMLGAGGAVYAFGDAPKLGAAPGPAVAISARTNGTGYWTVDAAGNVSAFGTATGHGGHPSLRAGESVSTISGTPSGNGYWLFTNRGRAFPFGDAHFFGDMSAAALNGPIVASVATPTGRGYFMVGSDGGVFNFGDARFHGSTGNLRLNRPIVGISPTPDNRGYWLVASDGGVFAFDAPFRGSMGGARLNQSINGLVAYGNGYLMVASDGGIFDFSDKRFAGSLAANPPAAPVIGTAAFSV